MSFTDPELERLVADMSVTRTPQRNGGGQGGDANERGTWDDESSTITGFPVTVVSREGSRIPREVSMRDGQAEGEDYQALNAKRFKIFVVPTWDTSFSTYCFQFIGQGASFCTARNCATSHHHASVNSVKPGEIYVAKSPTTAFVTPSITEAVIDGDVLAEWKSRLLTLPEWNEKFLIASSASDDVPASSAAMEIQETFFRTKALNFRTPGKRKRGSDDFDTPPTGLDVSQYSPFFKEDEVTPITDIGHVSGVLARLDQGITTNNEAILHLIAEYRQEHTKAGEAIRSIWLRLESLAASVGTVPKRLAFDYLSPSAWASIGAIAQKLDEACKDLNAQQTRLDSYKAEVNSTVEKQVKNGREDFYSKLEEFKTAFISASRGLGGRLDNVELKLVGVLDNASRALRTPITSHLVSNPHSGLNATADALSRNPQVVSVSNDDTAKEVARVELRVDSMERKLHGLLAKSDDRAILFAGLGFQSISDSNAWLESELAKHRSGLIVDAHMVFEHIYHAIEGIDTIATMEKLYKIKVLCIADSVAMTSFDAKTPKYFSKSQGHRVLKTDASYFDTIVSHAEWSDVGTGFKMRLQEALAEFQESHASFIDQGVEIGSKVHVLAHGALTESCAWIIGFIQFIDEYYRELSKAKFGPAKAWHVTTRLAKRILDEVGTPRYGVQGSFQVGDSTQICQQIFWAVLKSHDVMTSYKRLNFKNHPSIATELVKFLAINTSFEAIERVTAKVAFLEAEALSYKKQIAEAVKTASASANKADEAKKQSDSFLKRLTKLEDKSAGKL